MLKKLTDMTRDELIEELRLQLLMNVPNKDIAADRISYDTTTGEIRVE